MVIFFMTACNPNATKKLLGVWERIEKSTNERYSLIKVGGSFNFPTMGKGSFQRLIHCINFGRFR
jgi:hypothetical protein